MSPITDPGEIGVGDLVLVKWHQRAIFHVVGEIQGDRYLIVNSLGKVNGWVSAKKILGRITQIVEPEPCPGVPDMLEQLAAAYHTLVQLEHASDEDAQRLFAIVDDLRWYAGRLGNERWERMPRSNKWCFKQNLWRLTKQAKNAIAPAPNRIRYFIDRGKQCVGLASEIFSLYEYGDLDQ
jgi:hypothetical protein